MKQTRLLRSHAHALAIHRIEAAYRIAERQQPAWEFLEKVEISVYPRRKAEAGNLAELLSLFSSHHRWSGCGAVSHRSEIHPVPRAVGPHGVLPESRSSGSAPMAALWRRGLPGPASRMS